MCERKYVIVGNYVWGQLPSGEIREYKSILEYMNAYKHEEDEVIDELFRLENDLRLDDLQNDYIEVAYGNS